MPDQEYWFARRFPVGHPRNALAPVNRKGIRIALIFVAGMFGGAVLGALVGLWAQLTFGGFWFIAGFPIFIVAAAASGYYFIASAIKHADNKHTVEDYKAGRVPGQRYME